MANVKKMNRVQDTDIKQLNHVGLGLKTIADMLGCHPATITLRLKAMGVNPTDTRRSFMEQVFSALSKEEQEWLAHNLFNSGLGIKDCITTLIKEAYKASPALVAVVAPEMPEMQASAPTPIALSVPVEHVQEAPVPAEKTQSVFA